MSALGRGCLTVLVALVALAACGPKLRPLPPGTKVPDLRGTWRGVWGKSQLLLTLSGDDMQYAPSELNIGAIPIDSVLSGDKELTYTGTITYEIRGQSVSTGVRGQVAAFTGRVTLVLYATVPDGDQQLLLTGLQPNRLTGNGSSTFTWGPTGQIDLLREDGPPKPPPGTGARPPTPR